MPLFDRYLFADYSGGGRDHRAQSNIRLYQVRRQGDPERVFRGRINNRTGTPVNYSRDALREHIRLELDRANVVGERVVFGQDHQYGWPPHLRTLAGLVGLSWREAIHRLADGDGVIPPLTFPAQYCRLFNAACGQNVFWSAFRGIAHRYGIAGQAHADYGNDERFRLTELVPPLQGNRQPKSADALGGIGHGVVGGQTICGLRQISEMLAWDDVAWWPFDGLDITTDPYVGRHVAIEIYPSALVPVGIIQTDDIDADYSCRYVRDADVQDQLLPLLNLSQLQPQYAERVMLEGWIVGMNPQAYLLPA